MDKSVNINDQLDPLVRKSCPFCGEKENLEIKRSTEDREGYPTCVYCEECGAQGPWLYTRDKSIFTCMNVACWKTGWNDRCNNQEGE